MTTVFVLQHEYEWCGRDEVKFIGVYATQAAAEAAATRLREQPGFRNWPEGFSIDPCEIGVDDWVEGFVTAVNILVPSKHSVDRYVGAVSEWHPGDVYEILDLDEAEQSAFRVGDVVRCEERSVAGHGESVLVATEVVRGRA